MGSVQKKKTVWFGMKVTPEEKEKIRKLAQLRGVTQKQVILELVEKEIEEEDIKARPGSFYARNKDLCGVFEGPPDLSTNPKYMEGFGE